MGQSELLTNRKPNFMCHHPMMHCNVPLYSPNLLPKPARSREKPLVLGFFSPPFSEETYSKWSFSRCWFVRHQTWSLSDPAVTSVDRARLCFCALQNVKGGVFFFHRGFCKSGFWSLVFVFVSVSCGARALVQTSLVLQGKSEQLNDSFSSFKGHFRSNCWDISVWSRRVDFMLLLMPNWLVLLSVFPI